jgi:hypothetical protein
MIKSRRMRWEGHVERMGGEKRNAYRILVGKPDIRKPLGTLDNVNIKTDLRGTDWGYGLIHLVQDMDQLRALVNTVMSLGFS